MTEQNKPPLLKKRKPIAAAGAGIAAAVILAACPCASVSAEITLGQLQVEPELTVSAEYDDNVNLASGIDEDPKEDMVFHFKPKIPLVYPYKAHRFSLELSGDYREGVRTADVSDLNTFLLAEADFNFTGGLEIGLRNYFYDTNFDNVVYDEDGISETTGDTAGVRAAYTFVERLKVEGDYYHDWKDIEGENSSETIHRDNASGTFLFPILRNLGGYVTASFEIEDSDDNPYRDYDDYRYAAGLKWEGPYRFSFWGEAGYEEIDFSMPDQEDYDNAVGKAGVDVKFTESTTLGAAAGVDGYNNFIYELSFEYISPAEDMTLQLWASRSTIISYSPLYPASKLKLTATNVKFEKKDIFSRLALGVDGYYQIQDGYEEELIQDNIWMAKISLYYPIQEWLRVGVHYQYKELDSDVATNEYENNRVGMFVTVIY